MPDKSFLQAAVLSSAILVAGCVGTSTIRTSSNTAIVHASAAPVCGGIGSSNAAQKQAAIETIKAGYDSYIIVDAASANNVGAAQLPGSYQTTGVVSGGNLNATTTYRPGPTMVYGSHDQALAIKMFRDGDPGSSRAVSARATLGPNWQTMVNSGGVRTCS